MKNNFSDKVKEEFEARILSLYGVTKVTELKDFFEEIHPIFLVDPASYRTQKVHKSPHTKP